MNTKRLITILMLVTLIFATIPAIASAKGPGGGGGGGGGGHTEPIGNNLSFPVIWSEGVALPLQGTMLQASLTVPYSTSPCADGAYAYAQKTQGNVWQAENIAATEQTFVSEIDWGDSLESVDMKVGRPVRVELSLYKSFDVPMTAYTMVMLANPSSPDEVQGVCATGDPAADNGANIFKYDSYEATVYSPFSQVVIQKLTGTYLTWDGTKWVGDAGTPLSITFAGELNVGGKVIYGLSQGGWKPTSTGDYRITFFLPMDKNTKFDENTRIRVSSEVEAIVAEEGGDVGGEAYVDWNHNLTYIDVTVVGGGGGGRRP
jgi:hypothetical protein